MVPFYGARAGMAIVCSGPACPNLGGAVPVVGPSFLLARILA